LFHPSSREGEAAPPTVHEPEQVRAERAALGTLVQLAAFAQDASAKRRVEQALQTGYQEIHRLENLLSVWKPGSDIGRLNRAQGQPIRVSPETLDVLERALWASRVSDGAFDVTFQVMSDLWRFGGAAERNPRVPSSDEVARRLPLIDYRKIELDKEDRTVRLPPGMQVGLGGIGKGYILDRAANVLRACGLDCFLIQAGGDLLGMGRKPSEQAWRGGIQDPRGPRGSFFATLGFSDHAFSTAGDYAQSYTVDGRRYHHIIDPRTGYPAAACRSVTVWAKDAATADALVDAVFVLGPEKGLALVEGTPGVGAVLVDANNQVIVSRRLKGLLTFLRQPSDGP
jgi:FAD:protein FMN transferase